MSCVDPENFLREGGPNSQKGSDGKFQHGKINHLAVPGGGGGPDPLSPPLDLPMHVHVPNLLFMLIINECLRSFPMYKHS